MTVSFSKDGILYCLLGLFSGWVGGSTNGFQEGHAQLVRCGKVTSAWGAAWARLSPSIPITGELCVMKISPELRVLDDQKRLRGHVAVQREPRMSLRKGRKVAAGRGDAKMSASMMLREMLTT